MSGRKELIFERLYMYHGLREFEGNHGRSGR